MKVICMLLNNTFTNDSRVLKEATTLSKHGFRVTVLTMRGKGLPNEEKINGFLVKRVFNYDVNFSFRPDKQLKSILALIREAKKINADIYHAHDLDTLLPAVIASRKNNAKLIYDSHELWFDRNITGKYKLAKKIAQIAWRFIEKMAISRADAVITVNGSIADFMEKKYSINRVHVVMNCPEAPSEHTSALTKRLETPLQVLYLGKIIDGRGLPQLVQSAEYLDEGIKIVIVGDGPLKSSLENIKKAKKFNNVEFVGYLPPDQIITFAKHAWLGIAPIENTSLTYFYSSPNKVFEYFIAGLPVIVNNLPELSRIVKKYNTGIVLKKLHPQSLAQEINALKKNKSHYEDMQKNILFAVETEYSWQHQSKQLLDVYKSL